MKPAEFYRGREQSYLKHFVLEQYLERLAYNIFSFADEIVYVDGFSGPWRSENQDYSDTSFYIASHKLHGIAQTFGKKTRAIFIEQDAERFKNLSNAVHTAPIPAVALNGSFEELVPEISQIVGRSFAFYFIDPTGWTGLSLEKLKPLVANRNAEILINFMYDHVNRFLEHETVRESIHRFFGGPIEGIKSGPDREDSILNLYKSRLKSPGANALATSTRVKKPLESRAYFHLVYLTHHVKGLVEFKRVVEKLAPTELETWAKVKDANVAQTGQQSLFGAPVNPPPRVKDPRTPAFKAKVNQECERLIQSSLASFKTWRDVQELLLQHPDVWNSDVVEATHRAIEQGHFAIPELSGRKTKLLPKYKIERPV